MPWRYRYEKCETTVSDEDAIDEQHARSIAVRRFLAAMVKTPPSANPKLIGKIESGIELIEPDSDDSEE